MENKMFELDVVSVRLVKDAPLIGGKAITSPEEALKLIGEHLCELDREVLCVLNLRSDGVPINCHLASMGALDQSIVHPREIFKAAILSNTAKMILLHNHPSSNLTPSRSDIKVTERMMRLGEMMGIPVIDHIIVGGDNSKYFSFASKSILDISKNLDSDFQQSVDFYAKKIR